MHHNVFTLSRGSTRRMANPSAFVFDEVGTFPQNLAAYSSYVNGLDETLGRLLSDSLSQLADETADRAKLLDAMLCAVEAESGKIQWGQEPAELLPVPELPPAPAPTGPGWLLERLDIEGFRGINNEGAPLSLRLRPDCVNSISAPNGVGKSSIFDALSFAITGGIPKLDKLLQSEKAQTYYVNRFHPEGVGTVRLTLKPTDGADSVTLVVTRTASGKRSVAAPPGIDGEALLAQLNREFVLLDAATFQSFIDIRALDRGRMFSGLLGLSRYSSLRQQLQALANTRAFNAHFEVSAHNETAQRNSKNIRSAKAAIASDYEALVKEGLPANSEVDAAQRKCLLALQAVPVLNDTCKTESFLSLDVNACIEAIKVAEDGPKRSRLAEVIRDQDAWSKRRIQLPSQEDINNLIQLCTEREQALKETAGELMNELYRVSEKVLVDQNWPSPTLCPTCEKDDGTSVLDAVRAKLMQYAAVAHATAAIVAEWAAKSWAEAANVEAKTLEKDERPLIPRFTKLGEKGTISSADIRQTLAPRLQIVRSRAAERQASLTAERANLEKELPPSLVAVTTAVETARRLQSQWRALARAEAVADAESRRTIRVTRIKTFLEAGCNAFATAESGLATTRLKKVQPLSQSLFADIMFSPVVPALEKPPGSEELAIRLADFWGLQNVSAQALLSESFRNAFAVSVYLAAASLYSGSPRFIVLDDVTSSFDAGHQHHLVEVIRTRLARPLVPDGPQVIILSHDTLLEKLFNKHSSSSEWNHQRIEGTAQTAILPQSGAVNKVRDATLDLLRSGRIDDAAPRIRQYLEYTLAEVIDHCRIPVPMDLAFGDERRTPGEYLNAIHAAIDLHKAAGVLVLEVSQQKKMVLHSTTIVSNFLAHWSTGQSQAFSAPALLGVMKAIDEFSECFKYEPTPGSRKRFYRSLATK